MTENTSGPEQEGTPPSDEEAGVFIGMGEANTFEPEEDPDASTSADDPTPE